MSRILVVAAHPDDETIGVGATIARMVAEGNEAYALILGEGQTSRTDTREGTLQDVVAKLHEDSLQSAKIIGFSDIYFENFPDNRFDEVDLLDIVKAVEKYVEKLQPDIIFTHHGGDLNIDHQRTFQAVMTGTRPMADCAVKEIYCFETMSVTEWNFSYEQAFHPNLFVDVSQTIETKLKAMECYKSELREFPHPRSLENMRACARRWGSVVGKEYAEAFEVLRIVR